MHIMVYLYYNIVWEQNVPDCWDPALGQHITCHKVGANSVWWVIFEDANF